LEGETLSCAPLDPATLAGADAVVVVADHSAYDWDEVLAHARLVVDTRNATRGRRGRARVVKL
jgi:UDP-N-acetyl-D-glucosamine dehydrogenase